MSGEELLKGMGCMEERFIHEAEAVHTLPDASCRMAEKRRKVRRMQKKVPAAALHRTAKKKWSAAAACLVLLLVVSSTAIAGAQNPGIQKWLTDQWMALTGTQMDEKQEQTIKSLSQHIGKSVTVGDVTVTLDSYLGGRHRSWILLNVTGIPFSDEIRYYFMRWKVKINSKEAGGGVLPVSVNEDGVLQVLYYHDTPSKENLSLIDPPDLFDADTWDVAVILDGLAGYRGEELEMMREGRWKFRFEVPNVRYASVIPLKDTVVEGYWGLDEKTGERTKVTLTDICLSETGISLSYENTARNVSMDPMVQWSERVSIPQVVLLLKDGRELKADGGSGGYSQNEEGKQWYECKYAWPVPVNLEEIAEVRFGDTGILVE